MTNFLIVNSMEAAKELLEKRGSVYVDRPKFVFLGEMIGADYFTSLTRYGPLWRKHRSLLKHALSPEVIKRDYSALLTENAEQYVDCLVERPGAFEEDLKRVMAESTVMLTYGRLRDEQDRDYVQLNSYVLETTLKASQGYIVDLIPALRYIPSWAPGMKFKRDAARWRDEFHEITRTMFERAKKSVISGEANEMSSFMTNNLRDLYRKQEQMLNSSELEADEAAISHSGFTFFLAAVETTQYSVHSFLLAMVLFPSVQEKARLEIDRVVGDGRLPTFDDQQDMPYLHAILLETLRWNTVVTTGLPHASLRDDIYDGYFIPKGTTVIPNACGLSADDTRFELRPGESPGIPSTIVTPPYSTRKDTLDPFRSLIRASLHLGLVAEFVRGMSWPSRQSGLWRPTYYGRFASGGLKMTPRCQEMI
ncbi:hypothetical protein FRC05_006701 [Tulasnella sp. 425]|nr:hypothetical protein FRC05_006701 [Tulasnella sp. 425]